MLKQFRKLDSRLSNPLFPISNRFRDYESICKNIADEGAIYEFQTILQHMKQHGVEQSELVYYYELKTCTFESVGLR